MLTFQTHNTVQTQAHVGELHSSRVPEGDAYFPRLCLSVQAWKAAGSFCRHEARGRGQAVAVLFYDFHSFEAAVVGAGGSVRIS